MVVHNDYALTFGNFISQCMATSTVSGVDCREYALRAFVASLKTILSLGQRSRNITLLGGGSSLLVGVKTNLLRSKDVVDKVPLANTWPLAMFYTCRIRNTPRPNRYYNYHIMGAFPRKVPFGHGNVL